MVISQQKVKFGLLLPTGGPFKDPQTMAEIAKLSEDAGWDGIFLWDSIGPSAVDVWIALAAISIKTEKIKLGNMVTAVARRRPWKLAKEAVAIDQLSKGRLIFGAGLGDDAVFAPFGEDTNKIIRAQKLDEGLKLLNKIWSGEKVDFEGQHYQVKNVQYSKPIQEPRIPIWLGGLWPAKGPFKRAAKWDGMMPHTIRSARDVSARLSVDEVKEIMKLIENHRSEPMDTFQLAMLSHTPEDHVGAAAVIEPYIDHGMKWWVESTFEWRIPYDQALERIKKGPVSIR